MRLTKKQKQNVLAWIAEGIETDEINKRAAQASPPFSVSRQQVDWYRKTRRVDVDALTRASEMKALSQGLALKEVRVARLQALAALMERDLFGGFLWVENVKSVGSGPTQELVDYEEFNASEVKEYRGVLDDIAKEMGHRKQVVDIFIVRQEAERLASELGLDAADLVAEAEQLLAEREGV
jgi:hypothetical protein